MDISCLGLPRFVLACTVTNTLGMTSTTQRSHRLTLALIGAQHGDNAVDNSGRPRIPNAVMSPGLQLSARPGPPDPPPEGPDHVSTATGRAFGPNTLQGARRRLVDNLWTRVDNTRRAVESGAPTVDPFHTAGRREPVRPPALPRAALRRPPSVHRPHRDDQYGCRLSTEFTSAKTTNQGDSWRGTSTHTHPTELDPARSPAHPGRACPPVRRPGSPGPPRSRTVVQAGRIPAGSRARQAPPVPAPGGRL